jgi:hypothetical protein
MIGVAGLVRPGVGSKEGAFSAVVILYLFSVAEYHCLLFTIRIQGYDTQLERTMLRV